LFENFHDEGFERKRAESVREGLSWMLGERGTALIFEQMD